jgi:hypothetical protein
MKKFIIVLFAVALSVAAAFAAYTKQNSRVTRMQFEVVYNAAGTATAVKGQAFLVSRFINDADSTDQVEHPQWKVVNFDLLDPTISGENITAATKTVTYQQLAALLRQAALDRANANGIQ